MKFLKNNFLSNKSKIIKKKRVMESIKQNLEDYSSQDITISECLFKTGGLTADLIVYQNTDMDIPKKAYDFISAIATNYYSLLYIVDIHTSFYVLNKKNVYDQVVELLSEVSDEGFDGELMDLTIQINDSMYSLHEFTKELVDVYYDSGYEGCLVQLVWTIYSMLLSVDESTAPKKSDIEKIIRELPDRTFFTQLNSNEINHFLNYTQSKELPVSIDPAEVDFSVSDVHDWVKDLSNKLNRPVRKDTGYKILTTLLHGLRDEMNLQEIFQFSNHLPCCIRGIFFEGYNPQNVQAVMYNQSFLENFYLRMGPGYRKYLENNLSGNGLEKLNAKEFICSISKNLPPELGLNAAEAISAFFTVLQEKIPFQDLNLDKISYLIQETTPRSNQLNSSLKDRLD